MAAKYSGPKLPQFFLDEVGGNSSRSTKRKHHIPTTRKERRKAQRTQKKPTPRTTRPSSSDRTQNKELDSPSSGAEDAQSPRSVSQYVTAVKQRNTSSRPSRAATNVQGITVEDTSTFSPESDPDPDPTETRRLKEEISRDDNEISKLEKKLGIKSDRDAKSSKSFQDDGLDQLLEVFSEEDGSGRKRKRTEDSKWLETKRRRAVTKSEHAGGNELERVEDMRDDLSDFASNASFVGDLENDSDLPGEFEGLEDKEQLVTEPVDALHKPAKQERRSTVYDTSHLPLRENPYIAPGYHEAKASGKYVPPSLREPTNENDASVLRLRRQVKGLLNRLSEANFLSILGEVDNLYQNHARKSVSLALIDSLLTTICNRSTLTDTFIILHGGFIAALFKTLGVDFGAQMVQKTVDYFDKWYSDDVQEESGKETINLISLLAQLYNFEVVGAEVMFDFIRGFLGQLGEKNTELLLRIIRLSGKKLRQDDPSSLKDIVMLLQREISKAGGEQAVSVRTRYMMETISDLKNNKIKAGEANSAVNAEHVQRMRKALGALKNRNPKTTEPLRVTLKQIRNTENRGQWWLAGAGRASSEQKEHVREDEYDHLSKDEGGLEGEDEEVTSTDLVKLAKDLGMNTDIRRAIFISILSASDFQDAQTRLLKLNLTKSQALEIPRVLIRCVESEPTYNPYYALIARKLCEEHRMRMAFQFALWDQFKVMDEAEHENDDHQNNDARSSDAQTITQLVNLAKLFATLLSSMSLSIAVLKNLDLVYLKSKTKTFVESLLVSTMLEVKQNVAPYEVNVRLRCIFSPAQDHRHMVTGLKYFLQRVVSKTDLARKKVDRHFIRIGCAHVVATSLQEDDTTARD